jgi:predicted nucleotidyltransferase
MQGLIKKISQHSSHLKEKFGLSKIGIFGSHSIGTATTESDLDVLYEMLPNRRLTFRELVDFENELRTISGISQIDLVNQKYLNPFVAAAMENNVIYV